MRWDAFISYAGEDKLEAAEPLANKLSLMGFKVWYADRILEVGDSLRAKIDEGLVNSRYGVVILSPSFFSKHWPQKELDGLTAIESYKGKVVLPVLHKMGHEDLVLYSPTLASKIYLTTESGIELVAEKLSRLFTTAEFPLTINKKSLLTFESVSLSKALENYLFLLTTKHPITIKLSIDYSLLTNNLFPRLNEYKGQRFSHNAPEKDYAKVVSRTNRIFDNIKFLTEYFVSIYANRVSDEEDISVTIQNYIKLCLFDVYKHAARLLPLGDIQDWFYAEFSPIWDLLCTWTEVSENARYANSEMNATLLGLKPKITILDLVGGKGIEGVNRVAVQTRDISPKTKEMLSAGAFILPDEEITLRDWLNSWLPQVLFYHAINAADYKVNLTDVKDKIGLLKTDYFRMGYP
jgi:hypothetical protein